MYMRAEKKEIQQGGHRRPDPIGRRTPCPRPPPYPPPAQLLAAARARTQPNMQLSDNQNGAKKDDLRSHLPHPADLLTVARGHTPHGMHVAAQIKGIPRTAQRRPDPIGQRTCSARISRWSTAQRRPDPIGQRTCSARISRWSTQGLPVPPQAPATTAIVPSAHRSAQQHWHRAENESVTRTRTQQRRDRAKIVRTRMIVMQKSYLRPVRQADAGHAVPSTGAARLRRQQRAKAGATLVASHHTLQLRDPEKDDRKDKKRRTEEVVENLFDAEPEKEDSLDGVLRVFERCIDEGRADSVESRE